MVNLADLDRLYDETPVAPDFTSLPDGTYQGTVVEAHMKETRDSAIPMLELKIRVAVGKYAGRIDFFRTTFSGKSDSLQYAKRNLYKLGYKGPLSQLEAHLEDFLGLGIEFKVSERVKDGMTNRNVYLNKQIVIPNGGYDAMPPVDVSPPLEDGEF